MLLYRSRLLLLRHPWTTRRPPPHNLPLSSQVSLRRARPRPAARSRRPRPRRTCRPARTRRNPAHHGRTARWRPCTRTGHQERARRVAGVEAAAPRQEASQAAPSPGSSLGVHCWWPRSRLCSCARAGGSERDDERERAGERKEGGSRFYVKTVEGERPLFHSLRPRASRPLPRAETAMATLPPPGSLTRHLTPETAELRAQLKGLLPTWTGDAAAPASAAAATPLFDASVLPPPEPSSSSLAVEGLRAILTKVGMGRDGWVKAVRGPGAGRRRFLMEERERKHAAEGALAPKLREEGAVLALQVAG